jgi:uncharacterized coiled-coil DUF342 family protein
MTDLIERLRGMGSIFGTCEDAANELERLTAERDEKDRQVASLYQKWEDCQKERDMLVEALNKYGHHVDGCGHGWSCNCGYYEVLAKVNK